MRRHREALTTYLAAGIGLWGAMTSVYWSAQFIPSGLISILFGLSPVVTGVMAAFGWGERLVTPFRLAGLGLGLAGLSVVFAHGLDAGSGATLGIAGVLLWCISTPQAPWGSSASAQASRPWRRQPVRF